jgi:hypothetical protein
VPAQTFRNSMAGATTVENVFTGSQYEILTYPAEIFIAIVQDGGTIGDIVATVLSGTDVLGEEQPVSAANRVAIFPDDYAFNDIAAAMDRLKVKLRNTTAATTRIVYTTLRINPL